MKRILLLTAAASLLSAAAVPAQTSEKPYTAYMISNAHLDTQWNWDVKQTIGEFIPNTLFQNFRLFEQYPHYIFNFEGGVKYAWMKEYYPEQFAKLVEYIRQGRWHISGSSWDANDTHVPSPEAFLRNIMLGQHFYEKEFGVKSTDIFLPDCFGFSYTVPTIAAHCGVTGFSTQKLQWRNNPFYEGNKKWPFAYGLWQGVDGSRLMAALNTGGYGFNPNEDLSYNKDLIKMAEEGVKPYAFRYYGTRSSRLHGDQGGSPLASAVKWVEESAVSDGPVRIISATSDQLFKEFMPFDQHPELPVFDGELLMDVHGTGCYTSQAVMKRFNRRNEQLADAAERTSVVADWMGALPYQHAALDEAWKRFIWHQFHDDLTGTSIPSVYTYSWNDEVLSQTQFMDVMASATGAVAQALDTRTKGSPVVVYNAAAYTRTDVVEAEIPMAAGTKGIAVYGPDGKKVPAQLLSCQNGMAKIAFAATMKPVSYGVYDVRPAGASRSKIKASENGIENDIYRITLDANGDICSLIDKRNGKELVENGKAFGLALFTENPSPQWPAWEILKKVVDSDPVKVNGNVKVSVEECGELRAVLKVERDYGESHLVQRIILTDGATDDRIDIRMSVDWATKNALLKAEFPMSFANPEATYDLGIGTVRRGNNTLTAYEVCGQHWADLTAADGSYGISVLNNCKYGWDKPADNNLRLTLLHTPSVKDRYPHQSTLDFGHHEFTYSIVGHAGDHLQAGITAKAEGLNQPLLAFTAPKHAGQLGRTFSFVSLSTPQIALKALKKAEDGNGYIVRVFETFGKEVNDAQITFPCNIVSAEEVNGLEESVGKAEFNGKTLTVKAGKFAPKSYRVHFAPAAVTAPAARSLFVALPFNRLAISSDAFVAHGHMDREWNSYAAEIIPDTIVSGGIRFVTGEADLPNAVVCDGNVVKLPEGHNCNKLYLLAASNEGDREAVFTVDGKEYRAEVPYYAGFFAQWGWTGHSESYVRDAMPGYIGSHRHAIAKRNDVYAQTYMYRVALDIPTDAKELVLPKDERVVVFAATLSDNAADQVKLACEPRALP